jgi:ABC-type Fe3+ transport system substrate-binding protein
LLLAGLFLALGITLALPFLLRPEAAPKPARPVPSGSVQKLVLISPHWEGIRSEFGQAFSQWCVAHLGYPVELEWLDVGGTSEAVRYVRSEFARTPEGIRVDLFFGGGIDPYIQFAQDGLLAACDLPAPVLAAIPQSYAGIDLYDPQHRWFGACLAGFGILYNRQVCRLLGLPDPATWEDLGRPEFFSWVGSGDPRASGSVHMAYEIILQAYGWEKGWSVLLRMSGNTRGFSRAASSIPKDTAVGEVACGTCIDVYAWRQVAEVGEDRMGFCLPEKLTVVNPDGIAVLKGAPNPELAARFIEFVLTEPGQQLWSLKAGVPGGPREFDLGRVPVIPGLAAKWGRQATVTFDPYQWKGGLAYDAARGSRRWAILNDLVGAMMIDTHPELVLAWQKVKGLPADDARVQDLLLPPLTEADVMSLAGEKWKDAEFRARTCAQWATGARDRYRRIAGGQ